MRNAKVVVEDFKVSIEKGTESIVIDEENDGTYHLWITQRHGGFSIAVFRFDEDTVAVVSASDLSGVTEE